MKRLSLVIALLLCMLPVLWAQPETGARMWLSSPMKIKEPFIMGFVMGGLVMENKLTDRLAVIDANSREKGNEARAEIKEKTPGRSPNKESWERSIQELIAAMDAYYRLPEHKDVSLSDALYTVIFEPETVEKKINNDKK